MTFKTSDGNFQEYMCSVIVMVKEPEERTLRSCLKSIDRSLGKKEVIIVTPKPELVKSIVSDLNLNYIRIIKDEGKGIGIARNLGISSATCEIICFVDPDAIVGQKHFLKIVNVFQKDPNIGIINVEGEIKDILKNLLFNKIQKLELLVWEKGRFSKLVKMGVSIFAGGTFLSLRKSVWKIVGGFWEWPPYGGDDFEFSYRVYKSGWKCEDVKVEGSFHIPRATLRELYNEQYGWGKGYAALIIKYRNEKELWRAMRYGKLCYILIPSKLWFIIPIIRMLLAPISGFVNAIKWCKPSFLPYWTLRRFSFLYGLLHGLKLVKKRITTFQSLN